MSGSKEQLEAQVLRLSCRLIEVERKHEESSLRCLEFIHALGQIIQCNKLVGRAKMQKRIAEGALYGAEEEE